MDDTNMKKVIEVFKTKDNFLITAHINPEGDSIGSQLTVYYMLEKLGKRAVILNHDRVPENLRFLPGSELVLNEMPEGFQPDVAIVLDCPVKERTGKVAEHIGKKRLVINIDHHISNEHFGDINWTEPGSSSVGEMIFHMAGKMDIEIGKDMAAAIYAAIVTDTGMFNYSNTTPETHKIAGELIARGVDPKMMHREIFERKSVSEIRLLGRSLAGIEVEAGGALAHMSLTRKMYAEEGVDSVSTDEFIGYPRSIKGVEVSVFFKENPAEGGKVNVSFRSAGRINVNAAAAHFGGGGHSQAAGCVLDCGLEQAKEKVLAEIKKLLEENE